jgi:hypothetical protein
MVSIDEPGARSMSQRLSGEAPKLIAFAADSRQAGQALRLQPDRCTCRTDEKLIPRLSDHDPCAQDRKPMDVIFQGWSTKEFQAKQQWSRMSR